MSRSSFFTNSFLFQSAHRISGNFRPRSWGPTSMTQIHPVLVTFLICGQISDKKQVKEEWFILAHGWKGCSWHGEESVVAGPKYCLLTSQRIGNSTENRNLRAQLTVGLTSFHFIRSRTTAESMVLHTFQAVLLPSVNSLENTLTDSPKLYPTNGLSFLFL